MFRRKLLAPRPCYCEDAVDSVETLVNYDQTTPSRVLQDDIIQSLQWHPDISQDRRKTLRSKFHGDEVCTSQQMWNAFKTYGAPRLAACEELKVHTVHRGRHWKAITTVAPTGATGYWWRPDEDQWDAACRGVTCYGKLSVTDELHYPTDCSPC